MDDNLNFTSHISNICIKASQKVMDAIRYGITVDLLIVEKQSGFKNAHLRAVFNSHLESQENLLVRTELPSPLNRRLQDIAILMYKVKYGLAPSIVNELFKRKSTSYSLRNSDFDIPTFNTINYGKHSLRYQGPHIWSKLDIKLKGSSNIESFKKNIRKKDLTSLLNNNNSSCNLCNSQRLPFLYIHYYYYNLFVNNFYFCVPNQQFTYFLFPACFLSIFSISTVKNLPAKNKIWRAIKLYSLVLPHNFV